MAEAKEFSSWASLVFSEGLYSHTAISLGQYKTLWNQSFTADGFCPYCQKLSTFTRSDGSRQPNVPQQLPTSSGANHIEIVMICARSALHQLKVYLRVDKDGLQKTGQYPSLADIAIDEARQYRGVLTREDGTELHKAIGLAAHGVGIGSFVYLRRIFERLIQRRFDEHRAENDWDQQKFDALRMTEKVAFLKSYLPRFLVENRAIYGILSQGVHELSESECLDFFPILRASTVMILEEDRIEKERRDQQASLLAAISRFSPKSSPQQP